MKQEGGDWHGGEPLFVLTFQGEFFGMSSFVSLFLDELMLTVRPSFEDPPYE